MGRLAAGGPAAVFVGPLRDRLTWCARFPAASCLSSLAAGQQPGGHGEPPGRFRRPAHGGAPTRPGEVNPAA
jgi:hypothetical protein